MKLNISMMKTYKNKLKESSSPSSELMFKLIKSLFRTPKLTKNL